MEGGKDRASGKNKSIVVELGGTIGDDGIYHGVREITLVYDRCIGTICVVYDKNSKPFTVDKHEGFGGNRTAEVRSYKAGVPNEILISSRGHFCPVICGSNTVIRSLAFKSNKRNFGPFGVEDGTPFIFSMDGQLVVGFKGRNGLHPVAIGFRLC